MRTTSDRITALRPGEIFVFGSNLGGQHGGGAARLAWPALRCRLGPGCRIAGPKLCHPDHAGRRGDHRPLCRRLHSVCPAASGDDLPCHRDRMRHRRLHAGTNRPALRPGPRRGEYPFAGPLLGSAGAVAAGAIQLVGPVVPGPGAGGRNFSALFCAEREDFP